MQVYAIQCKVFRSVAYTINFDCYIAKSLPEIGAYNMVDIKELFEKSKALLEKSKAFRLKIAQQKAELKAEQSAVVTELKAGLSDEVKAEQIAEAEKILASVKSKAEIARKTFADWQKAARSFLLANGCTESQTNNIAYKISLLVKA